MNEDDLSISIFNIEPWWTFIITSLFITPSTSMFSLLFPDDTNDGYHIILKWMQSRWKTLLSSSHLIQSAPLERHTPRCSWNMWKCPQETPWGWRRNMWLKHPALSLLYLTVLLLREWLLPQRSNSPLLALPLSPINGYIYASWKRLVALQLLSLFVSWASGVPKLVCRLF